MNSSEVKELFILMKGYIGHLYARDVKICRKDELPIDIIINMELIIPVLRIWERKGYIKFIGQEDNFFEIINEFE